MKVNGSNGKVFLNGEPLGEISNTSFSIDKAELGEDFTGYQGFPEVGGSITGTIVNPKKFRRFIKVLRFKAFIRGLQFRFKVLFIWLRLWVSVYVKRKR